MIQARPGSFFDDLHAGTTFYMLGVAGLYQSISTVPGNLFVTYFPVQRKSF